MELLKKQPVKGVCYVAPSVDIIDVFAENTFCSGGGLRGGVNDDEQGDLDFGFGGSF